MSDIMDMEKFLNDCGEDPSLNKDTIEYRKKLLDDAVMGDLTAKAVLYNSYNLRYIFHNGIALCLTP